MSGIPIHASDEDIMAAGVTRLGDRPLRSLQTLDDFLDEEDRWARNVVRFQAWAGVAARLSDPTP